MSPIAIGGVGGSGTRVVASFLRELDFYMGSDLNSANDNLWFTLLFARPRWFTRSDKEELFKGLCIFEKAMKGNLGLAPHRLSFIIRAAVDLSFSEYLHWGPGPVKRIVKSLWPARVSVKMAWAMKRIATMILSSGIDTAASWGWKEPCSYIYLEYLAEYFDDLKYIHVVRHGLDMAYSHNQGHLYSWGHLFGVEGPDWPKVSPSASLDYWIRSNQATISLGKRLLGNRFLIVNYDRLCKEPRSIVEEFVSFLELDETAADVDQLCGLCKTPRSAGRYKKYDLDTFGEKQIDAVQKLGFVVDGTVLRTD